MRIVPRLHGNCTTPADKNMPPTVVIEWPSRAPRNNSGKMQLYAINLTFCWRFAKSRASLYKSKGCCRDKQVSHTPPAQNEPL